MKNVKAIDICFHIFFCGFHTKTPNLIISPVHFLKVVENAVKEGEKIIRRETFDEKIFDFFIKSLSPEEIFAP